MCTGRSNPSRSVHGLCGRSVSRSVRTYQYTYSVPGRRYLGRSLYPYVYVYTTTINSSSTGTTVRNPVSGYQNCSRYWYSCLGTVPGTLGRYLGRYWYITLKRGRYVGRSLSPNLTDRPSNTDRVSSVRSVSVK